MMRYFNISSLARNLLACVLASGMLAACGGSDSQTAPSTETKLLAVSDCTFPAWVSGKNYAVGDIVLYSANGKLYRATNANPGYDPTISTWYWSPYSCTPTATTTTTKAATTTTAAACNYPNWISGASYGVGAIVKYPANGLLYRAKFANPGYDPTISTYYWEPYTCTGGTTTTAPATTTTKAATTTTAACNFANWVSGASYNAGAIVKYPANGQFYRAKFANPGYDPTISTYYWEPYTCTGGGTTTTTKANTTTTATGGSGKIIGGYYPNWKDAAIRVRDLPANYNLVYLFSAYAAPGDTSGRVSFAYPAGPAGTNLNSDIAYARSSQGRKIILSVGGAGHGMYFHNRTESTTFFNSIVAIYNQLGGVDGMDWNTFEADTAPSTNEMIWISQQLKARYGAGFLITAPPAPWNSLDKDFCKAMVNAGAMDYAAPQYYDGPGLNEPSYVVPNVQEWVNLLGASHVVVGFGINNAANYMSTSQATSIWNSVKAANPGIRGGFDWEINTDQAQGWPFANTVGALIKQ